MGNRFSRRRIPPLLVLVVVFAPALLWSGDEPRPARRWVSLFNGRDLDGWTVKIAGHPLGENFGGTFRVENGMLKVSYDRYRRFGGQFGHIFYDRKLSHYRIRVEYRFTGTQVDGGPDWGRFNNGVMVHAQSPESMGRDQSFPVSIEAQILGDDGSGGRTTGNVCTPGTLVVMAGKLVHEHCIVTSAKAIPPGEWTTMEVEVRGDARIRHLVNGQVVSEYEKPQLDPDDPEGEAQKIIQARGGETLLSEGYVALQAESQPIEFRKVELMLLDGDDDD